jgi:RNA polymerase sigma factor (sigma-70 family)
MEPRIRAGTRDLAPPNRSSPLQEPHRAEIARVVTECQKPLFKYIFWRVQNYESACDIMQTVFRTVCEKWHLRHPGRPPLPWLKRIAYRKIIDCDRHAKAQKRGGRDGGVIVVNLKPNGEPEVNGQPHNCISPGLESRHEALNQERDQIVADAIATLTQREKEIIRQKYWEDASIAEIANFLEKSVEATTSQLNRIRDKIRIKLVAMGVSDTSTEINRHLKGDTM